MFIVLRANNPRGPAHPRAARREGWSHAGERAETAA